MRNIDDIDEKLDVFSLFFFFTLKRVHTETAHTSTAKVFVYHRNTTDKRQ